MLLVLLLQWSELRLDRLALSMYVWHHQRLVSQLIQASGEQPTCVCFLIDTGGHAEHAFF